MKRSQVNDIIRAGDDFIRSFGFILPPFAYWSPGQMRDRVAEIGGIVGARLGWDITDYGQGRFDELGLFLFTVRNGSEEDLRRGGGMCYAEKIMISRAGPGLADAPAHREGRGHHQPRRRDAGAEALQLRRRGHIDHEREVRGRDRRRACAARRRARCCGSTPARA